MILGQNAVDDERFHKFTSTTVHHLQEPVRMIRVYAEMLEAASAARQEEEQLQALQFLQKASLQMQRLLDGLTEFAGVTGSSGRAPSAVRLELPLRQALLQLGQELKSAGAQVSYAELPVVTGDFDRLQMLFQHLLRNAIQYRSERAPVITISAQPAGQEWLVEVHDNGPGIPPEFREKIFELYFRLHGKNIPGNGLGLSVCNTIVQAHGGRIWVADHSGEGSTVSLTLPLRKDPSS
jgi:chemotaxis family two-component system sensor kinase Cph1